MGDVDRECEGKWCSSTENVMKRQVTEYVTKRLCPECADRMRATGEQTRASEPPEEP